MTSGGYLWWYVDVIADDGRRAITIIGFVGSVFSPFYARERRARPFTADPENHCGLNVVVYDIEPGQRKLTRRRWAFTEYPRDEVRRGPDSFHVGRNRLGWEEDDFVVQFAERTAPVWLGRPLRGSVRVTPSALPARSFRLDPDDRHRWWPIAPHGRAVVEVEGEVFEGSAYLDCNWGDEPLGDGFARWQWSRAELHDATLVLYDAQPRRGEPYERAMRFGADGVFSWVEGPTATDLPKASWGMQQATRVDAGATPAIAASLEDAPFYTRNLLETRLLGQSVPAMHEALDMDQWRRPLVQAMLPVRMRRRLRPR